MSAANRLRQPSRAAALLTITLACLMLPHSSVAQGTETPPQDLDDLTALSSLTPETCRAYLDAQHVNFSFTPPVTEDACAIPLPVKIRAMATGGTDTITFGAEPILDCRLAVRLTDWIGNVVAPLAEHHLESKLASVETGPGYACRNRNNASTGKLSEHAKGNAIDIAAFITSDGSRIAVRPTDAPTQAITRFLTALRTTACGYFRTTLGPGSDAAHAEHLHLDLRERKSAYRICQ